MKKQQIQIYRMGVRLNEWLKKISEAMKYKKTMDTRELEKWIENLRDSLSTIHESKSSAPKDVQAQMLAFEE